MLLGSNPATNELVANGVGRRPVEIILCGNMAVLDEGVVEVAVEGSFHGGHVFQLRQVPHGDLLLAVARARRGGHDGARVVVRAASHRQLRLPEQTSGTFLRSDALRGHQGYLLAIIIIIIIIILFYIKYYNNIVYNNNYNNYSYFYFSHAHIEIIIIIIYDNTECDNTV